MRILLTGGSSFTGSWFVRELAAAGHAVTATFRRPPAEYPDDVRRRRARLAAEVCEPVHGVSFGDDGFLDLVRRGGFDVLAHHAAEVANYRSPDFDALGAVAKNAHRLDAVLKAFAAAGGRKVVLTGSVFEGGEGSGSQGLPHFSPYGLSKALTAELFRFHCQRAGLALGKFVVPNPFGPYEDARYTAYLMKSWLAGEMARCMTPLYVRDNIHVSLLARAYVRFVEGLDPSRELTRQNPSGYVESQGAFTLRVAAEMRRRLGVACDVTLERQTEFPEPRVRVNTDVFGAGALGWDEAAAWDAMARYYREPSAG